jgi:hypothetical protein
MRSSELVHVLDTRGHLNPPMHAPFVHRECGRGKGRVGERTDRNRNFFATLVGVVHRRTASGTEVKRAPAPGIPDPNERARSSGDRHGPCGKTRLRGEYAARSTLAGQAVANGNANGIS